MIIARLVILAILRGYLIVALALLALFGLFAFMEEAGDIGDGAYSAADAVAFVTLSLPATLLDLAPFVILLGTIFGLAGFLRSQELLALRAAGLSPLQITGLAAAAGLLAGVLVLPLELSARPLLQQALLFRVSEQSPDGNLLDRNGSWIARGNTFVYVGALRGGERPSNVSEFVFDDDLALTRFMHARDAQIMAPDRWRLRQVEIRRIGPDGHDRAFKDTLNWRPIWYPAALLTAFPLGSLTLGELRQQIAFLTSSTTGQARDRAAGNRATGSGAPGAAHALEFWRRALTPIMLVAFAVIGAGLILR
ncbi:MAG: LptF/LptG family permease, partial [Gammaproteobacteria bacterium]